MDVDKVDIFIKTTYTASVTECLPLLTAKSSHPFFIKDSKAEIILHQIFTVPCMWCPGLNMQVDFGQIHWLSMSYHTLEEMFNTKDMTATRLPRSSWRSHCGDRAKRNAREKQKGVGVGSEYVFLSEHPASNGTASRSSGGSPHWLKGAEG